MGDAPGLGRDAARRSLARAEAIAERPRLPRRGRDRRRGRDLRLAARAALMDAIFSLDRQLYTAIVAAASNNPLLAALAIAVAYLDWLGRVWWISAVLVDRARCWGSGSMRVTLTV